MLKKYIRIKEESVGEVKKTQVLQIVTNQISKRIGKIIKIDPIIYTYQNSSGTFSATRLFIDYGPGNIKILRLNQKIGNLKYFSFDLFLSGKRLPDITCELVDYNILQSIDIISKIIIDPVNTLQEVNIQNKLQESTKTILSKRISETKENKIEDFLSWINAKKLSLDYLENEKIHKLFNSFSEFVHKNNLTGISAPTFSKIFHEYLRSKGRESEYSRVRVSRISPEKRLLDPESKKLLDFVKSELKDSTGDVFEYLKTDVDVLSSSFRRDGKNLLIVTGVKGMGKTVTIQRLTSMLKVPYAYGRLSVKNKGEFHKLLYQNNRKIIIIDDSNDLIKKSSIFRDQLLAITDSTRRNRITTYINDKDPQIKSTRFKRGKYPQTFLFEGALIVITNLPFSSMYPAFVDRAIKEIVSLSNEEVLTEVERGFKQFYPDIDIKYKMAAVDFLRTFTQAGEIDSINFRTYQDTISFMSQFGIERGKREILTRIKKGAV